MIHVIKQINSTCILIINSPLSIGMQNRKRFLKDYSLILIIKYNTTTTVGSALNKCYIHDFIQNAAHHFFYLHQRYLVLSPNCVCDPIENNKHYLLVCH